MSRKPRVITAERIRVRPDDLIKDDLCVHVSGQLSFCDGERLNLTTVSATRTAEHADPIDYFSEIDDAIRPLCHMWYQIDAEHEYVRKTFPWVSVFCDYVVYCPKSSVLKLFASGTQIVSCDVNDADDIAHAINEQECHIDISKHMLASLVIMCADEGKLIAATQWTELWGCIHRDQFECIDLPTGKVHFVTCVFEDKSREKMLCVANNLVRDLKCRVQFSRRNWEFARPDTIPESIDQIQFREIPVDFANFSMSYHYDQIMEAAIGLLSLVPPYVVLWIVDFLPKIKWLPRVKKIQMIEAVRDSINTIRVKKNLEPYWHYDI